MKNDVYFPFLTAAILAGLFLAAVSAHAAVPLPAVYVTAKAPHWQLVAHRSARNASALPAAVHLIPMPPPMPAPAFAPIDLRLR